MGSTSRFGIKSYSFSSLGDSRDNNFDIIRLVLAIGVMFSHCYPLCYGNSDLEPLYRISRYITVGSVCVACFFILSGYLITASASRSKSVWEFALKRFLRIAPAYYLAIILSAIVLVPFFDVNPTGLGFVERSRRFLNAILTFRQYELPSVFATSPFAGVMNGSLWTIQYEITCYALVGLWLAIGLARTPKSLLIAVLITVALLAVLRAVQWPKDELLWRPIPKASHLTYLSIYFLVGAAFFCVRRFLTTNYLLTGIAVVVTLAYLCYPLYHSFWVISALLGYSLLSLTAIPCKLSAWLQTKGDFSYGIYIYAFPVQQVLVALTPDSWHNPLLLFILAIGPVLVLAVASWHCVEKPALILARKCTMSCVVHRQDAEQLSAFDVVVADGNSRTSPGSELK